MKIRIAGTVRSREIVLHIARFRTGGIKVSDDDIHHWNVERARLGAMLTVLKDGENAERKRIETQIAAIDKHLAAIKGRRH